MDFSLCAFVCDVHASTNAGTYIGMHVSVAIMCTQIHSHVRTPVLCSTMNIRKMSQVHGPQFFGLPEIFSLPELCGLLASALEEGRQGEELGVHRMLKCSGSSNLLADELISFLTTLKSQEGIVACFGDKKVKWLGQCD